MQHKVHNLGMSYSSLLLRQADATLVFNRLFSCKYLSNEFEIILWKSKAKVYANIYNTKQFWSYLVSRTYLWEFKNSIFCYFAIFWVTSWKQILGKQSEACVIKYFTKRFWRYYVLQKGCSECLKRLILTTL